MTREALKEEVDLSRLQRKLDEFEKQMELDRREVFAEMKFQLNCMRPFLDSNTQWSRQDCAEECLEIYDQIQTDFDDLELKLDLASKEVGLLYEEKRDVILGRLDSLQALLKKAIDEKDDNFSEFLGMMKEHSEKVEDKLEGLHLHFILGNYGGNLLEQKKAELREGFAMVARQLKDVPKLAELNAEQLQARLEVLSKDVQRALARFFEGKVF